jgi:hypothetical protein
MSHREDQKEYRRLKTERSAGLKKEAEDKQNKKLLLQRQKSTFLSHDDVVGFLQGNMISAHDMTVLSINSVEGGWKITYIEKDYHVA